MDVLGPSDVFLFEDFLLDRRGLSRRGDGGAFVPVKIGSRALDIVRILIERAGDLVLKDEIITAVWPGMVVEDSNLTVQIAALRHILRRFSPCLGRRESAANDRVCRIGAARLFEPDDRLVGLRL